MLLDVSGQHTINTKTSMCSITVKNCTNIRAKVFGILEANYCTKCYYNFNLCVIFEKTTSFSPILNQDLEQGKFE